MKRFKIQPYLCLGLVLALSSCITKKNFTLLHANEQPVEVAGNNLHEAAKKGDLAAVRALLEKGATVDARDERNRTPLHWAAKGGHRDVAELLIENGAKVEARAKDDWTPQDDWTPLHFAAEEGHRDVAELLIEKDAEVEARGKWGKMPLHYAAEEGHLVVAELLIAKGAKVEARDKFGNTPLEEAANRGHLAVAELLIEKGAEVEARNNEDWTLLHSAARGGHLDVAELLIAKGAKVKARDKWDVAPLHLAASRGHLAVAELLIKKGAEVEARGTKDWTPLHEAAERGHLAVAELLIQKGAKVEARDDWNNTPLHWAAQCGHLAVAELLIKKGAEVEARNKSDLTPLHRAASRGRRDVVVLLIEKGVKVEAKVRDIIAGRFKDTKTLPFLEKVQAGMTPLQAAAAVGETRAVQRQLQLGAAINAPTADGTTPLQAAAGGGYTAIVEILIQQGASLEAQNKTGNIALQAAAAGGHTAIVWILIKQGASLEAQDKTGNTALHTAAQQGHAKSARVLARNMLRQEIPLNIPNNQGDTPLHLAAQQGHQAVVQELLEAVAAIYNKQAVKLGYSIDDELVATKRSVVYDAMVSSCNHQGDTPLRLAYRNHHYQVADFLYQYGADIEEASLPPATDRDSASQRSASQAVTVFHEAITTDAMTAAPPTASHYGLTLLHEAIQRQDWECARRLLQQGANIHATDIHELTPLHYFALYAPNTDHAAAANSDFINILVSKGADIDPTEATNGLTPLYCAVMRNNLSVTRSLIALGANVHAKSRNNNISPLMLAQMYKHNNPHYAAVAQALEEKAATLGHVSEAEQLGLSMQHVLQATTGNLTQGFFDRVASNLPIFYRAGSNLGRGVVDGGAAALVNNTSKLERTARRVGQSATDGAFVSLENPHHRDLLNKIASEMAESASSRARAEVNVRWCVIS
ncbi:MAG: ankyrin repeat domain-containing protein [Cytophagales bacterium]|nr:ankyrin repeat domain-containing protein [Cytophagales bacterium]